MLNQKPCLIKHKLLVQIFPPLLYKHVEKKNLTNEYLGLGNEIEKNKLIVFRCSD